MASLEQEFTESPSNGPPIADMENLSISTVTKRGMAMHMAGIIIYSGSALLGICSFVRAIDEDDWYQVFFEPRRHHGPGLIPYDFDETGQPKYFGICPGQGTEFKEIALISELFGRTDMSLEGQLRRSSNGFVGLVQEDTEGVIYCKYIGTFNGDLIDGGNSARLRSLFPPSNSQYGEQYV
ncbi:hypothetical protein N7467_010396 [Penicillium canescens]|nr:hypothetical protein N7467_010396 [Penicillium canescens]